MKYAFFKKTSYLLLLLMLVILQSACGNEVTIYAPVSDAVMIDPIPKSGIHNVQRNETLYSIAWRYGLDPHYLAKRNQLSPPYELHIGQALYLKGRPAKIMPPPSLPSPVKVTIVRPAIPKTVLVKTSYQPRAVVRYWYWPARGPLIRGFSSINKGINIGGHEGDPIFAAAAGKVVYSGDGLRRYGNLIIIEHNDTYMTAYAYNKLTLVKEGQMVKEKQKIAQMGKNGAQQVMLHFEIRKKGKPMNPLAYLDR